MRLPRPALFGLLIACSWVMGCGAPEEAAEPFVVTLRLEHQVGGEPLDAYVLDTPFTNAFGNEFGVTRLVYFLSDLTLTPDGGGEPIALLGAHYVDHEQAATRQVAFSVPAATGKLGTLAFTFGLPPALNVTGKFPHPPESLMEWPEAMGGGYHHMKFEGRYLDGAGNPAPFKAHSGPAMREDHSFGVTLDASAVSLGEGDGGRALTLVMNLERWFGGPNVWNLQEQFEPPSHGMMDSPVKQASLRENGADVFTLETR